MKRAKINIELACKKLNDLRRNKASERFSREQLLITLSDALGVSVNSVPKYIPGLLKYEIVEFQTFSRNKRLYHFVQKDQYNIERVKNALCLSTPKRTELNIFSAIEFLKKKGYVVMKPTSLNLEKLREKYGEGLNDCFDYETV